MSSIASLQQVGISRRAVLAGGAALAASASLAGGFVLRDRPNGLARLLASSAPRLSVAFVEGASTLEEAVGLFAVPALSVPSGDAALLGRAIHVRVHGTTPGAMDAAAMDALVPSPSERGEVLPFYAWSTRGGGSQASSPVGFTAAAEDEPTLGLRLHLPDAALGADGQRGEDPVAVLSAGRGTGMVKLREGLLLVGLAAATWSQRRIVPAVDDPSWAGLQSLVLSVRA